MKWFNLITNKRGTRDDIEEADDEESFYIWLEENPNAGVAQNENDNDQDLDYDDEGNIIVPEKSKVISLRFFWGLLLDFQN